ncbi:RNA pseudouridylate synthase domain-containing protein 1-like [Mya arenaria]|uniref:RNA pseudouridylate synthase domain-containing protein 1-like n=1 Tax=Mya arenaria TaxID=6604 RepID=UPI0022E64194|nr:RNA pseudouridylate synthase domain-containing protein 1-like [Mya arenaria]XP_052776942.1 RNA pseudouridylate synthase domain-containing protein 1-like [Mya arenaria]XP_052776943.1 RNA pseudouridylate synthase domain-containing protein 1-like [Mya arenaria]
MVAFQCTSARLEHPNPWYSRRGKMMPKQGDGVQRPGLQVVHKSPNFLCIDKMYDLKINSDDPTDMTVKHQARAMFPELVDPKCSHGFRFVHRLDYATSGILCLGLTKNAAKHLSKLFHNKQVTKYYLALVRGHIVDEAVLIDVPIGRLDDAEWAGRMCAADHEKCDVPRPTATLLVCLERGMYGDKPATKVLLKPITGRQHQLRVHCDYIGHTIVGDYTYSLRQDKTPHRMMLHSHRLVADMKIENLDLRTSDPFTTDLIEEWNPSAICRPYEEAESIAKGFEMDNMDSISGMDKFRLVRIKLSESQGEERYTEL